MHSTEARAPVRDLEVPKTNDDSALDEGNAHRKGASLKNARDIGGRTMSSTERARDLGGSAFGTPREAKRAAPGRERDAVIDDADDADDDGDDALSWTDPAIPTQACLPRILFDTIMFDANAAAYSL